MLVLLLDIDGYNLPPDCFTCVYAFYRAAAMQVRSSYEHLSVRPSVRLAVKRVNCDKTKASSEKSSIMTNRKSTMSLPMSLR